MTEIVPCAHEELEDAPDLDVTRFFENLGDGPLPQGRPDDYPGVEIQTILHVLRGFVAGKQFAPDPMGERRAIKVSDCNIGSEFIPSYVVIEGLDDVFKLLKALATNSSAFLVRGMVSEWAGTRRKLRGTARFVDIVKRRMIDRHDDGALEDVDRQLQMLDLDGVELPERMSVVEEPQACAEWAVDNWLPPEFREASFVYQMSSSAGLSKPDNTLSVHLWFFSDREYSNRQLREWGGWWNAKKQKKIIDTTVFTSVQPLFTNDPRLSGGLTDSLVGRRLGRVRRRRHTVRLYMPSELDLIAEGGAKVRRARKAQLDHQARSKTIQDGIDDASDAAADAVEAQPNDEREDYIGALEAVRFGPGWRGYLECVGFEGHIRTQIRAAIGSYFYERSARADPRILKNAISKAIADSPFLDCGEGSRSRKEALDYLSAPSGSRSNVDEMIAYIIERQKFSERRADEVCEPSWLLPTLSAEEAFAELDKAVHDVVAEALSLRRDRAAASADGILPDVFFHSPGSTAVLCEPGVGKSSAMMNAVVELLRADPSTRIAVAVPTHPLGREFVDKINKEFGSEIAAEWYGTEHADPQKPQNTMCRLSDAAKRVTSVGGKREFLCSSKQHGYCPHHPKIAGPSACGYMRQRQLALDGNVRVWIVPAIMLAMAPPPPLRRPGPISPSDFDLLVIDEGPWFSMVAGVEGKPVGVSLDWLSPAWWAAQTHRGTEQDRIAALDTLMKLHDVLTRHAYGPVSADPFYLADVTATAVWRTRRFVWRCKADLRRAVRPGMSRPELEHELVEIAPLNGRVLDVAQVLEVIGMRLDGRLAPSGVELVEAPGAGGRFLQVRWRKNIHRSWLRAPVLYLDAAAMGAAEIAKNWLPDLVIAAEARAKAPYMRITQVVDTTMSYRRISSEGIQEKLARIIEERGPNSLVICPKKIRERWKRTNRLPGRRLWNFGAIRGRDEANDVRQLVVISRTSPPIRNAELLAETIFGREINKLPSGQPYPKRAVGRLLSDGTGRRALADYHPDPFVETVRFAICEAELLQAIGRGRGVRRQAEAPLDVLLLTDVPLPVPIDSMVSWDELSEAAGPIEALLAKGIIPLDQGGIAAALPDFFTSRKHVKEWFRNRPRMQARLAFFRERARRGECPDVCELVGISNRELSNGKHHQLALYRYRHAGRRQRNLVLIDDAMHADPMAAITTALGPVDKLERVTPARHGDEVSPTVDDNVCDEADDADPIGPEWLQRFWEEVMEGRSAA